MKLNYYDLIFTYQPHTHVELPDYIGSTFRGAFGHALKKTVCVNPAMECSDCPLAEQCLYLYAFETTRSKSDPAPFPGLNEIPHPYIIQPLPGSSGATRSSGNIQIGVKLFGPLTDALMILFQAMSALGKIGIGKGKIKMDILELHDAPTGELIYTSETSWHHTPPLHQFELLDSHKESDIILELQTPLRLPKLGQNPENLDAAVFILSLLRRFQIMVFYFGLDFSKIEMNVIRLDIEKLIFKTNLRYEKRYRYSNRQHKKIPLHGFVGNIEFSKVSPFIRALLQAGKVINIGKGAVMGLGNYKLVERK
ncbi:MAG: CRISPR system precrRNA processing endoribonuclease RAMP protein Cas6 [Bacteroidota bacterium]|nr:CRISPR system precrRNA processing endoribonuclease RAMP protein Cas6 [Bacteroidota bacterium]